MNNSQTKLAMKRINFLIVFLVTLLNSGFSQSYREQLKRINDYLKTFDNGYYGYLEIKDDYLYDRFKDGTNYCKGKLSDLDYAFEKEKNRKVDIACKGSNTCVFSTFTNQDYNSFTFSQSNDFNTTQLIKLFNDFITAYKNSNTNNTNNKDDNMDYGAERKKSDSYKSNISINEASGTKSKNNSTGNYQTSLEKLNTFLKPMDAELKKWIEIKNGYIIEHFRGTYTSKAKISDIEGVEKDANYNVVHLYCKNKSKCVYSDYMKSDYDYFNYNCSSASEMNTLYSLMTDFWNQLTGKKSPATDNNDDDWIDEDFDELAKVAPKTNTSSKTTSSSGYQSELKKLNDYLKTFDNGYYGYFEVKDGYIYDRFKAGKYNKFKMEDMEGAEIQTQYSRVIFKCKGDNKCISTDWKENGKEDYTQFVTSGSYNYQELATLLDNFRDAYLGKKPTNSSQKYTESSEFLDGLKSNIDIMSSGNSSSTKNTSSTTTNSGNATENKAKAEKALQELNDYMVTLDNGRYKGMEVTNGYIIQNYGGGQSSKAKIEDIDRVEINTEYNYAKLACKGDSKCVYSTITGSYHDYFNFNTGGKSLTKMETLLNNFLTALKKWKNNSGSSLSSVSSSSVKSDAQKLREQKDRERQNKTQKSEESDDFYWMDENFDEMAKVAPKTNTAASKYETPLKNINDYLKIFNPEIYKGVEVKNGKVYFKFYVYGTVYNSYIDIASLINNTIVTKGKSVGSFSEDEIKISCKGDSKCFYSEYSNGNVDHFRFFSRTEKDLTKMQQLVNDFIKSLK